MAISRRNPDGNFIMTPKLVVGLMLAAFGIAGGGVYSGQARVEKSVERDTVLEHRLTTIETQLDTLIKTVAANDQNTKDLQKDVRQFILQQQTKGK